MKSLGALGVLVLIGIGFGALILIGLPGIIIHYWRRWRAGDGDMT